MIHIFKTLTVSDNYIVNNTVASDTVADLMFKPAPAEWDETKRGVYADIQRFVLYRPGYADM